MRYSLNASFLLSVITLLGLSAPKAEAALLVGNSDSNNIILFDEASGSFLGNFTTPGAGGLRAPDDLTIGPDGNLYVSMGGDSGGNILSTLYPTDSAVLRFSPTGQFLGIAASGNGLTRPYGNAFGPDGSLFVSSFRTNQILRFDGTTGDFLGVFASDNNNGLGSSNGLNGPNGLLFGPDGSLYVATEGTANTPTGNLTSIASGSQVLRYTPDQVAGLLSGLLTTAIPEVFVPQPSPLSDSFNFVSFLGLALAPDEQSIFVSDFAGGIRQYGLAGNLLSVLSTNYTGTSPSNNFIGSLTFGSGSNSNDLYAIGFNRIPGASNLGSILQFSGAQGSPDNFTGIAYTDPSLVRPIGVTSFEAVPEPSTIAGLALGLGGLMAARRKKRSQTQTRG